jgi:hypothetical protein
MIVVVTIRLLPTGAYLLRSPARQPASRYHIVECLTDVLAKLDALPGGLGPVIAAGQFGQGLGIEIGVVVLAVDEQGRRMAFVYNLSMLVIIFLGRSVRPT